jgi:hypothetical protein
MAAFGHVTTGAARAAAGAVRLELLLAADSTTVGEPEWTYDDGSFYIYFPVDRTPPGPECFWGIRATVVATGESQTHGLEVPFDSCAFPGGVFVHDFEFGP